MPRDRAKLWLQRVWRKEAPLSEVPDEHYQRVRVLLREAEKTQARLYRILGVKR